MEIKPVYFSKIKEKNNQKYIVVTDKPAIKVGEIAGISVGVRQPVLKFGTIKLDLVDSYSTLETGDLIPGFTFTDQKVNGYDNLYKIEKVR